MATRTLPRQKPLELFQHVSGHVYLVRYRPGREEEAAEAVYRFVESEDLNFDWQHGLDMGDQLEAQRHDCLVARLAQEEMERPCPPCAPPAPPVQREPVDPLLCILGCCAFWLAAGLIGWGWL